MQRLLIYLCCRQTSNLSMSAEKNEEEKVLKKKYREQSPRIVTICGITKGVATRIAKYIFDDKYVNILSNKEAMRYDLLVKSSVNEKTLSHFKNYWKDTFNVYKIENK